MVSQLKLNSNDFIFDVRTAGDPSNEMVILLHGFPETSHMWEPLMKDLEKEGFYCIAPNQRGYSKGATPKGKSHYAIKLLSDDIMKIGLAFGKTKFHLVGHDWGAVVGWYIAHHFAENILSWTALSVPHIQAFAEAMGNNAEQRKMSTYIRNFQLPWLPEFNLKKNDFASFKRLWKNSSKAEMDDYLSVFRTKGTLTAALNYYRANYGLLKSAAKYSILGDVIVPTLFIWGEKDPAIGIYGVKNGHKYLKGPYQFLQLNTGHWLLQTKYEEVSVAIISHLKQFS